MNCKAWIWLLEAWQFAKSIIYLEKLSYQAIIFKYYCTSTITCLAKVICLCWLAMYWKRKSLSYKKKEKTGENLSKLSSGYTKRSSWQNNANNVFIEIFVEKFIEFFQNFFMTIWNQNVYCLEKWDEAKQNETPTTKPRNIQTHFSCLFVKQRGKESKEIKILFFYII